MSSGKKPIDRSTLVVRQNAFPAKADGVSNWRGRLLNWIVPVAVLLFGPWW